MYCKHCGSRLSDDAIFCHNCGASTSSDDRQPQQNQQPLYQNAPQTVGSNTLAIVGFILAMFFPIVGLVCSILGYIKSKNGAPYGGLALAGIIVSAVLIVLYIILFITLYRYFYDLFLYIFFSGLKAG